jgi:hypothetical protein
MMVPFATPHAVGEAAQQLEAVGEVVVVLLIPHLKRESLLEFLQPNFHTLRDNLRRAIREVGLLRGGVGLVVVSLAVEIDSLGSSVHRHENGRTRRVCIVYVVEVKKVEIKLRENEPTSRDVCPICCK